MPRTAKFLQSLGAANLENQIKLGAANLENLS